MGRMKVKRNAVSRFRFLWLFSLYIPHFVAPSPCRQFGVCSQKCTVDKSSRHYKCYCDDGYAPETKGHQTCKAIGKVLTFPLIRPLQGSVFF